jgi:DNA-binding XRE family transcriptional regulator
MRKVMEKPQSRRHSALDRLETEFMKRVSYRKVHSETESVVRIAEKLVDYRAKTGLSQEALAKKAGISRKQVNEIEGLGNTNPSLKTVEALARAMDSTLSNLVR